MNTYVTLACLLAVVGLSHGSAIGGYGLGGGLVGPVYSAPILAPAAISTANQWRAAPIPIVKTVVAAPIIRTVPIVKTIVPVGLGLNGLYGGLGGLYGGYGGHYGGLGGHYGGHGLHG